MENMDYDVGKAFAAIENELLDSMMRNMKRHRVEETKEGFQWEQWQAKQLAGLEEYRRKHKGKLEERYEAINSKMRMAILQANAQGKMAQEKKILEAIRKGAKLHRATDKLQGEFFRVNDRKMNALLDAVESDMKRAESAILRMHDDKTRRAIFNAQVYANSGAGTYEKAVDMAVKDYAAAGINCVRYKDGKQVNIKSYARMALKTAGLRAYLTGEGAKRQEWGIHTVIINKRGNPCPLCLPWVGKVMVDDVWSGGTAAEAKKMGYPLISQAMNAGLYHPNCRDSHTTYFPGISTPPDKKWKKSELAAVEKNVKQEARRQYAERQEEKFDRLERCAMDPENKRVYAARREEWEEKSGLHERGHIERNIKREGSNGVNLEYINSKEYEQKFEKISNDRELNEVIYKKALELLRENNNTDTEGMYIISTRTRKVILHEKGEENSLSVQLNKRKLAVLRKSNNQIIGMHNHPTNLLPNGSDFVAAGYRGYRYGIVVTHDGRIYKYSVGNKPFLPSLLDTRIDKYCSREYNLTIREAYEKALNEFRKEYGISWQEIK